MLRAERARALLLAVVDDCVGAALVTAAGENLESREAAAMWLELHQRLRAFVARRVPDRVVVDDLAQEIMLRLYTQIARLRERDRLDAWAYQVARNVIADHWRARAAARELPLDDQLSDRLAALPEPEDDDDADTLRAEIASCLAPMVDRLAEPYREAIRLTDLGAQAQTEAATALGLSVPGMKARVQRGRAQLRDLLRACCRIQLDRLGRITELERSESAGDAACGCAGARS